MSERCPWKIHWGVSQESTTQCDKDVHLTNLVAMPLPDGRVAVDYDGDGAHAGPALMAGQRITWQAGDRREYTGDWPGLCPGSGQGCTLHAGHHGDHAP
jgi:hypothetical protein